jgi:hypothetical protein
MKNSYANDMEWGGATSGKHAAGLIGTGDIGRNRHMTRLPHESLVTISHRVALALQADGRIVRMDNVWHKPLPIPKSIGDRPKKSDEYVFPIARMPYYYDDAEALKEPLTGGTHPKGPKNAPPGSLLHSNSREKVKNNVSFTAAVPDMVTSRNKRSVWTINPAAFPDAHYATFPPALARICLLAGTSAHGACAACGAPWQRVVVSDSPSKAANIGPDVSGGAFLGRASNPQTSKGLHHNRGGVYGTRQVLGWEPTCECGPDASRRPCVAFDPFLGSGTVAEVAHELGLDWLGFDLDPRSVGWTANRLRALPVRSLFAAGG